MELTMAGPANPERTIARWCGLMSLMLLNVSMPSKPGMRRSSTIKSAWLFRKKSIASCPPRAISHTSDQTGVRTQHRRVIVHHENGLVPAFGYRSWFLFILRTFNYPLPSLSRISKPRSFVSCYQDCQSNGNNSTPLQRIQAAKLKTL